jgi:hypothetical protein
MSDSVRLSDEKSGGCFSPAALELAAAAANPRLTEEPLVFAFVASSAAGETARW